MSATILYHKDRRAYNLIDWTHPTKCWVWAGSTHKLGYGRLTRGNRQLQAHRWIYEQLVGPIPVGLDLDHLCRRRNCVNPEHLEPVTHAENVRRGDMKRPQNIRTHCPYGHAYTPENIYRNGLKGGHACRICKKARDRRRRAA